MKKTLNIASMILGVAILSLSTMTGCVPDPLPEYESGYFRYAVSTEDDGSKKAYLIGLTELGEQQKILVYPEYIDQIKVYGLGYHRQSIWYLEEVLDFESANLEKLFLPTNPKESDHPNAYLPNGVEVTWNLDRDNYGGIRQCKAAVWGYNYYVQFVKPYESNLTNYIANVSYMYNYAGAENEGYYWVDSYDEAVITFIPPDPERLGYLFGGWYKEPACITPWNFETDKTGELIVLDGSHGDYDTYEGAYLYAKWVRNS